VQNCLYPKPSKRNKKMVFLGIGLLLFAFLLLGIGGFYDLVWILGSGIFSLILATVMLDNEMAKSGEGSDNYTI